MKFIRKNGRIIPIKEKAMEKELTKSDVKVGLGTGLVKGMFWKRQGFGQFANLASLGHGAGTTFKRVKSHENKGRAVWEDVKSSLLKSVAHGAGYVVGAGAALKLSHLSKLRKLK